MKAMFKAISITTAAAALALGGISAPAQARWDDYEYNSWGACSSSLNQGRRLAERSNDPVEIARWDAAYCHAVAFKHIILIFPI